MTAYSFYQLMTRPLDAVVPRLVEKALAAGHRLLITAPDIDVLRRLDAALWSYAPDAFVPHALYDAADSTLDAAAQPVLLAPDGINRNSADVLLCSGALPDDHAGYARVLLLFDGTDAAALAAARAQWKALAGAGERSFWQESGSGWARAA